MGRVEIPPIPEEPENNGVIQYKLYFLVLAPFDVRGFCQLRISYEDVKKDDDCYGWIPALRRIRRLTGKDLTDPILGSDTCLDDFECWQQKINTKLTFKLDNSEFLVPATYSEKPLKPYLKGNCYQVKWEKRPLYILDVYPNDPDYIYSKRVIYVDKEGQTFALFGAHEYDQKGRIWRSLSQIIPSVYPDKHHFGNNIGAGTWWGSTYFDHISGHSSIYDMFPIFDDPECTPGLFSIKGLLKEAR